MTLHEATLVGLMIVFSASIHSVFTAQNVCKTYGSGIIETFNKTAFHLRSTCSVTLTRFSHAGVDCHIIVQRGQHGLMDRVEIIVNKVVTLIHNNTLTVEGSRISLPYDHTYQHVFHYGIYTKLKSKVLPLSVIWLNVSNGVSSLWVQLDQGLLEGMSGLCGHQNSSETIQQLIFANILSDGLCLTEDSVEKKNKICENIMSYARECLGTQYATYRTLCLKNMNSFQHQEANCSFFKELSLICGNTSHLWSKWRTISNCSQPQCPGDLRYKEMGPAFPPTCTNPQSYPEYTSTCLPAEGKVLNDRIDGYHSIDVADCPCVHGRITYAPGQERSTKCQTCTCVRGRWTCSANRCPPKCIIEGQFITTFDGKQYSLLERCTYVAAKGLNWTLNIQFSGQAVAIEKAYLNIHQERYTFSANSIKLNNIEITDLSQTEHATVFWQSSMFIQVQTSFGLKMQVQVSSEIQIYVYLPPSEKTKGLCGTFNNDTSDDFTTFSGITESSVQLFAQSWSLDRCSIIPGCINTDNEIYAEENCDKLKDPNGVFAVCHDYVPVSSFVEACVQRTCQCSSALKECLCVAFANYAKACASQGIIVKDWRSASDCLPSCMGNLRFDYSTLACNRTCRSLAGPDPTCEVEDDPVEGCGCTSDTHLSDQRTCNPRPLCSCHHPGGVAPPGPVVIGGRQCMCENGHLQCPKVCDCPVGKICVQCSQIPVNTVRRTCESLTKPLSDDINCISGCYCPEGFFEDHNGGCVAHENCTCKFSGKVYATGESVETNCKICTCRGGEWSCIDEACSGVCEVFGNGQYRTFDSKWYRFDGHCQYTLVKDAGSSGHGQFAIKTESVPCCDESLTCSRAISVELLGEVTLMLSDMKVSQQTQPQGGLLAEPLYSIHTVGLYIIISVPRLGLTVIWDKHTRVTIQLESQWRGRVWGLCGNFDGKVTNDLMTSSHSEVFSVLDFGNSWKTAAPPCSDVTQEIFPCERHSYCAAWAQRRCMILRSDTFKDCHLKVDPEPYYQACVLESCSCEFEGKFLGFCTAVAAYAEACSAKDVCINWRTPDLCPVYCDYYNEVGQCSWHYDPCGQVKTCGTNNHFTGKLEGCYPRCPAEMPFYDENTEKCSTLSNCTCNFMNRVLVPGEEVCTPHMCCKCLEGNIFCSTTTTTTSPTTTTSTTSTAQPPTTTVENTTTTQSPTTKKTTKSPTTTREYTTTKQPTTTQVTTHESTTEYTVTTQSPTTETTTKSQPTTMKYTTTTQPPTTRKTTESQPTTREYPTTTQPTTTEHTTQPTTTEHTTQPTTTEHTTQPTTTGHTTQPTTTEHTTQPTTTEHTTQPTTTGHTTQPTTTGHTTQPTTTEHTTQPTTTEHTTQPTTTEHTTQPTTTGHTTQPTTTGHTTQPTTTGHTTQPTTTEQTTQPTTTEHTTQPTTTGHTTQPTTTEYTTQPITTGHTTQATTTGHTTQPTTTEYTTQPTTTEYTTQPTTTGHTTQPTTTEHTTQPTTTEHTTQPTTTEYKTQPTTTEHTTQPTTTEYTNYTVTTESPTTEKTTESQPTTSEYTTQLSTTKYTTQQTTTEYTATTEPNTTDYTFTTQSPTTEKTTKSQPTTREYTTTTTEFTTTIHPSTTTETTKSQPTTTEYTTQPTTREYTTEPNTTDYTVTTESQPTTERTTEYTTTTQPTTTESQPTTREYSTTTHSTTTEYINYTVTTESPTTEKTTESQPTTTKYTTQPTTTEYTDYTITTGSPTTEKTTESQSTTREYTTQPTTEFTTTIHTSTTTETTESQPTTNEYTTQPTTTKHTTEPNTTDYTVTTQSPTTTTIEHTTTQPLSPTATTQPPKTTMEYTTTTQSTTKIPTTIPVTTTTEHTTVTTTELLIITASTTTASTSPQIFNFTTEQPTTTEATAQPPKTTMEYTTTTQSTTKIPTTIPVTTTTEHTTVTTTVPCECKDVLRNQSWACERQWREDCSDKVCTAEGIVVKPIPCPPLQLRTDCPGNKMSLVKDEQTCCESWECDCQCEVYGDPHYVSFQGISFDFLENCTYSLVEETVPRHHLSITVDNYFCEPDTDASCAKGIILKYWSDTITLMVTDEFTVESTLNRKSIKPPYEDQVFRFESSGGQVHVFIKPIRSYVSLTPYNTLLINLATEHFLNNTQGQCGVCGGPSCIRRTGVAEDDNCCDKTAYDWVVEDPLKPYCKSPRTNVPCLLTTTPRISSATPSPTPCYAPICDLLHHPVFEECGKRISLTTVETNCRFDYCLSNSSVGACSSLEYVAAMCKKIDICVDWRHLTSGSCEVKCPEGMIYDECRQSPNDVCQGGVRVPTTSVAGLRSGCFCPDNQVLADEHKQICVFNCTNCKGPLGEPMPVGAVWESNCHICTCNNQTRTEECRPKRPEPAPQCSADSVLVSDCCNNQKCVDKTCEYNGATYKVGARWTDPSRPCESFSCSRSGTEIKRRACPLQTCAEELRVWDKHHCCYSCDFNCAARVTRMNITISDCTQEVELPSCEGRCETQNRWVQFNGTLQLEQDHQCCKESGFQMRELTLTCSKSPTRFTYKHITSCRCKTEG